MRYLIIFISLLMSSSLSALLPPFYQSVREIKAILSDPRLNELVGNGEWVEQVVRSKRIHGYRIMTQKYVIPVEVVYLPSKAPGRQAFELKFGKRKIIPSYLFHEERSFSKE